MYNSRIVALTTLESMSPYSQSRFHNEPKFENEDAGEYDQRTWRSHLHVVNGKVVIPAKAIHDCLIEAAQYSGKKIVGAGQKTWTAKFEGGIAILDSACLGITPDEGNPPGKAA